MTDKWETVKNRLLESVSEDYLEFMSSREILLLFISGETVEAISKKLDVHEEAVSSVLLQFFPECGRMYIDNEINPAYMYRNKQDFKKLLEPEMYRMYSTACKIFYELDDKYKKEK